MSTLRHSVALQVVQRNLRKYLQMRTWAWYRLWQKVKPLLNVTRVEDEIKALEDKAAAAQANFEKEEKLRKELEGSLAKMTAEKNDLLNRLQAESGTVAEFHDKQNKLMSQKADLEAQLSVTFISTLSLFFFASSSAQWMIRCRLLRLQSTTSTDTAIKRDKNRP